MELGDNGLELVKHFEGCFLKAYKCPAGIWTIGYGHTGLEHNDGTVHFGRVITREQADELLRHDMGKFARRVNDLVKFPLTQDQFDALVSFDFNTGALGKSTLLKVLNAGRPEEVPAQLMRWNRGGGKVLKGLTRRRMSEYNLWLGKRPFIVETL